MNADMTHHITCTTFNEQLDYWLEGELDHAQQQHMQSHCEHCTACQAEACLAAAVNATVQALPELQRPELMTTSRVRTRAPASGPGLIQGLLQAWYQPLVLVPAMALVMAVGVFVTVQPPADRARSPDLVVVNGQEYSQEELIQAAEELELALRYLDRYGTVPARVVHTELQQSRLPLPPPRRRELDALEAI